MKRRTTTSRLPLSVRRRMEREIAAIHVPEEVMMRGEIHGLKAPLYFATLKGQAESTYRWFDDATPEEREAMRQG